MDKARKSLAAVYIIVAIIYTVIVVLIPFNKPAASWIAYAFTVLSFILGYAVSVYAFGKGDSLKSKFYGFPVFRIGYIYTLVQTSLSVIVLVAGAFTHLPYIVGLLPSLVCLGAAAVGVIAADNTRDYVESVDAVTECNTKAASDFNINISEILDLCKNDALREPLKKLLTKFRYSDPVSSVATEAKEAEIATELAVLKGMITGGDTGACLAHIEKITNLLAIRNRICAANKK